MSVFGLDSDRLNRIAASYSTKDFSIVWYTDQTSEPAAIVVNGELDSMHNTYERAESRYDQLLDEFLEEKA